MSHAKHLVSLRKNVKEKIEAITEQQQILTAILDDYVTDTKMRSEYLMGITDYGHFMNNYMDVMKSLDACFNTFVLLTAEAENFKEEASCSTLDTKEETISKECHKLSDKGANVCLPEFVPGHQYMSVDFNTSASSKAMPVSFNHNLTEYSNKPVTEKQISDPLEKNKASSTEVDTVIQNQKSISADKTVTEQPHRQKGEQSRSERPRIDSQAAKRFLSGIIQQAEKDKLQKSQDNIPAVTLDKESKLMKGEEQIHTSHQAPAVKRSESWHKLEEESKTEYGLGPQLGVAILSVEQPVTVVVTEPSTPWQFFVQQIVTGLDKLMEQIFSYMLKKGEDRGRIEQPLVGMICLAKYSLDNIYYRAKVTQVYNINTMNGDTAVEVLFIDYGNSEKRSSAYLRELPQKFAQLPAQAIACALAKVAPTNKYGIWTENDINTFSQFVASNQFSCVNVCPSEDPDFPQLVELYLYSPVPTIRDGKFCVQTAPTSVSIGDYLKNQGRAKTISLEDEVQALKKSRKVFEKLLEMTASNSSSFVEGLQPKTAKSAPATNEKPTHPKNLMEGPVRIPRPVKLPRPHVATNKDKSKMRTSKTAKIQVTRSDSFPTSSNLNLDMSKFNLKTQESVNDDKICDDSNSNIDSSSVKSESIGISLERQQENHQEIVVKNNENVPASENDDSLQTDFSVVPEKDDSSQQSESHSDEIKINNLEANADESVLQQMPADKGNTSKSDIAEHPVNEEEIKSDKEGDATIVTCKEELPSPERQNSNEDNENELAASPSPVTVENFLCDLDLTQTDMKILNNLKQEDQLSNISSNISSESGFVAASTEGGSMQESPAPSGCRKIDLRSKVFNVMLSHVRSPSHFYVHVVSKAIGKTLDNMMKNLNREFEALSKKGLYKLRKTYTPKVDDLCCAQFSEDGFFYRAVVTAVEPPDGVTKQDSQVGIETSVGRVYVFYLDFGDREWLPKRKVFPLPPEYKDTPPLSLSCGLAHVRPAVSGQEEGSENKLVRDWPENVTDAFVSMTGFEKIFQLVVVTGNISINMESFPGCGMVDNAAMQVFLIDSSGEEEVCINLDLIRLGHATLVMDGSTSPGDFQSQSGPSEMEVLAEWDPMAEDFLSIRNSYNIDIDDPGIATQGYHAQDEKRICKYYVNNSCWRGDRCPYRHVHVTSDGVTLDQEPVYAGIEEYHMEELLPEPECCVAVEVITILNPGHFYIILPLGKKPLDVLHKQDRDENLNENEDTLEGLVSSMQYFYGNMIFSDKTLVNYAEGEIIAARFSQDGQWYRAKVLSTDDHRIQVFFVDFGNREWVIDRNVRNIDPQFLHLPFQAIECFMIDIEPVGDQYSLQSKQYFRQLVDGKTLVAYVKARSWSGCLWVDLFDTSGPNDVNIRNAVIKKGLAQKPETYSDAGSGLSSRSTSERSLVLLPG